MDIRTLEYVILATSHEVQDTPKIKECLWNALKKHSIRLIAEEFPCDTISVACNIAKRLHIPYLQIDLFPDERRSKGIDDELTAREKHLTGRDIRLSHADAIREDFWLEKIEDSLNRGPVLIICGYLRADFLEQRVRERGNSVNEKIAFPSELVGRNPSAVLSPTELERYLAQ